MAIARPEPFGFFTMEALKAGWYLSWRLWLRLLLVFIPAGIVAGVLMAAGAGAMAPIIGVLAVLGSMYWVIRLTNTIASQWAEKEYGRSLSEGVRWGIFWRSTLVGIAMSVGVAVMPFLFGSASSMLAGVLAFGLGIAQIVLTLQATGWSLSVMVSRQLDGIPADVSVQARPAVAAAAPRASAITVAPGEKVQCPKCGLYETEKGVVMGWRCRICGWNESRS